MKRRWRLIQWYAVGVALFLVALVVADVLRMTHP